LLTTLQVQLISTQPNSKSRFWPRLIRVCLWIIFLGLISPFYAPFFQAEVKALAHLMAWRNHFGLRIGAVSGSLWEPLRFHKTTLTTKSQAGTISSIEISNAEFSFSWKNVVLKRGVGWFQKLRLEGVNMLVSLPKKGGGEDTAGGASKRERRLKKIPLPVELEAQRVNLVVQQGIDYIKIAELQFGFQAFASGPLLAKEIVIHHPKWEKKFTQVYGAVALQDEKIFATDVLLEPGLTTYPELLRG